MRSVPAKSATDAFASARSCNHNAASRSPAAHPRVRSCSSTRLVPASRTPWPSKSAADSAAVNARSSSRTSRSSSRSRSRDSCGSLGSTRVAMTSRSSGLASRSVASTAASTSGFVTTWRSSSTSTTGAPRPLTSATSDEAMAQSAWAVRRSRSSIPSSGAAALFMAATTCAQNRRGSLSARSSVSQMTAPGRSRSAIHEANSTVLPMPADAATTVKDRSTPALSWSRRRGRLTTRGGRRGTPMSATAANDAVVVSRPCGRPLSTRPAGPGPTVAVTAVRPWNRRASRRARLPRPVTARPRSGAARVCCVRVGLQHSNDTCGAARTSRSAQ